MINIDFIVFQPLFNYLHVYQEPIFSGRKKIGGPEGDPEGDQKGDQQGGPEGSGPKGDPVQINNNCGKLHENRGQGFALLFANCCTYC